VQFFETKSTVEPGEEEEEEEEEKARKPTQSASTFSIKPEGMKAYHQLPIKGLPPSQTPMEPANCQIKMMETCIFGFSRKDSQFAKKGVLHKPVSIQRMLSFLSLLAYIELCDVPLE